MQSLASRYVQALGPALLEVKGYRSFCLAVGTMHFPISLAAQIARKPLYSADASIAAIPAKREASISLNRIPRNKILVDGYT